MLKISRLRTVLSTLVSTSIASSLLIFPLASAVREGQANLSALTASDEIVNTSVDSTGVRSLDEAEKILGITALGLGAGAAGIVWRRAKAKKPLVFSSTRLENALSIDRASPQLRQKLLRLLHNDRPTANRLLAGAQIQHPERSVNWLVEKVIYDLERDRGRY
ncbi:MAG: hypothetical protein IGR93_11485 [Hydrococcus sp. C42_A2020_068]|uniref:hypothetical protein n=1 Tax=Pleurocapsa sp. PCC 7327 TaxID=118163 RepID=UPI00029F9D96|nr:hypothetical protein [Pleurocapsa sp. PCC 7327]AFY79193.1 hypothetical protein Ple7327_4052 [Pleurocapsa sp. PCC 7327]MBF2020696.1 hypothetical protein [Hydrococcus sp. C42_A2020_068]